MNTEFKSYLAASLYDVGRRKSRAWREFRDGNIKPQFYEAMGIPIHEVIKLAELPKSEAIEKISELLPDIQVWSGSVREMQVQALAEWSQKHPGQEMSIHDLIQPALTFVRESRDGREWEVIPIGTEIPEGFHLFKTRKGVDTVYGSVLYPSLKRGYFPLVLQKGFMLHDWLGHFAGYLLYPEYARAYRRLASWVADQEGGYMSLTKGQRQRLLDFNEQLVSVDRAKLEMHMWAFDRPVGEVAAYGQNGYSKEQVLRVLETMTMDEVMSSAMRMIQIGKEVGQRMGGSAAEIGLRYETEFIFKKISNLEWVVEMYLRRESSDRGWVESHIRSNLARLQSMMLILGELHIETWAEIIKKDRYPGDEVVKPFLLLDLGVYHREEKW